MDKKTVLLVLCRRVIADLLIETIEKRPQMKAHGIYEFKDARAAAATYKPQIALVEIPEAPGDPALKAFDVCKVIKEASPDCKIVMLCPEADKKSVTICVQAKKLGEIEAFLFYEASVEYLVSQLEAL